jgi:hypothetical protein
MEGAQQETPEQIQRNDQGEILYEAPFDEAREIRKLGAGKVERGKGKIEKQLQAEEARIKEQGGFNKIRVFLHGCIRFQREGER